MGEFMRRIFFRWAFKGCTVNHPEALAYIKRVTGSHSLENEITIERALEMHFWAGRINSGTGATHD